MSRTPPDDAPTFADLADLAQVAQASAKRSIATLDETARLVAASNARIAAMEAKAQAERERQTNKPLQTPR